MSVFWIFRFFIFQFLGQTILKNLGLGFVDLGQMVKLFEDGYLRNYLATNPVHSPAFIVGPVFANVPHTAAKKGVI